MDVDQVNQYLDCDWVLHMCIYMCVYVYVCVIMYVYVYVCVCVHQFLTI